LQYRESADIDLRFTKDGQPVNAGTAGSIVISGDIPDAPRNTNPFPAIEAAYVLPEAKTFTPAAAECIDTGLQDLALGGNGVMSIQNELLDLVTGKCGGCMCCPKQRPSPPLLLNASTPA